MTSVSLYVELKAKPGKEEEVAALIPQAAIEFNGEGVIPLDERRSISRGWRLGTARGR